MAALAGAGDTGGNLFFLLALAQATQPVAVVLSSLYPVQTTLLARFLLHERLSRLRLRGVGLAVLGVVLISVGGVRRRRGVRRRTVRRPRRPSRTRRCRP